MVLLRRLAVCLILTLPASLFAQPNPRGVSLTHVHLNSADPDVAIQFWTSVIGTSTYSQADQKGVSMLGGVILFSKGTVAGPSSASTILHVSLEVPDIQPFVARLAKTSFKGQTQTGPKGDTLVIEGPDGVQIELAENSDMYTSLQFGHIHMQSPKPVEMQAWYGAHLGARPGDELTSRVGGAAVIFSKADSVVATKGRAIDHISVETRDMQGLLKALAADGIQPEPVAGSKPAKVFLTDPWGTLIEVTEAQ